MQWGAFHLNTVRGGYFRLDGGAMFGVVPQSIWRRTTQPDDQNRIRMATNCVLVRTGRHTVVIDTGFGTKLSPKELQNYEAHSPLLVEGLAAMGVQPADVDTVIFSHLHFDHAGGATRWTEPRRLIPTFPAAEYVVQRREWEAAMSREPEWVGTYSTEELECLDRDGRLRLIDGEAEIVPGITGLLTGGHSLGHQILRIESDGCVAVYLGDLCPTWNHLRRMWCMAYDADLARVRRLKPTLLGQIADHGWLALSDHDPDHPAAYLRRDDQREFALEQTVATDAI